MDKSIRRLTVSIFLTFILVVASIPLWSYSSGKKGAILAESYKDLSIAVDIGEFSQLLIIEDERALEYVAPTYISLRNKNNYEKEFELIMLIDKTSTIDYKFIRIAIDDKIYKLADLEQFDDNDNYYFILGKYSIDKYSSMTENVRLWLGEEIGIIDQSASITTNFITR